MKTNRTLLYAQLIAMYAMHTPLYIILILFQMHREDILEQMVNGLLWTSAVILLLALPLCFVTAGFSIASVFKGDESPAKATMIVKLALIPWYIMNFIFCFVLVAGFMNPFLMIGIPLLIAVMMSTTYLFMLATGLPDMAYVIHRGWKERVKPNGLTITGLVFLFIFCLDILGGIFLHVGTKPNTSLTEK